MTPPAARELQWEVHGLNLAGLAWGSSDNPPLLALHGWLDNAASFALIAPHLAEHFYVVALDLTGHGHSDSRSADATYQVYDDLPEIMAVVDQLGWQRFDLMGHSRGATIAALFAASFPEYVNHLVLLDGVAPPPLSTSFGSGRSTSIATPPSTGRPGSQSRTSTPPSGSAGSTC